ncbi:uncharacterized protein LOC125472281 [Pyrus x bretschneideri]|uniref:uncharacterized protein LOC125472281 n=1 Tax=Pyrus x bretschneideri TaxID=225117 RepID=UPI00202F356F|nr:uncharacterized protein LOC125472281 [Pyrus x bretschneideri]
MPPEYINRKKQELTELRQGKLIANEYYRRFTNLSCYYPDVVANPTEMLRRFHLDTKKKWRSMATTTPCDTYQEFYEILLRIEDSENMPSESEEEEKDGNQRKDDKGKGQASLKSRKTQSFKRGGTSSSSSSGGFGATGQGRGGRFARGTKGQRQGDAGRERAPGDAIPYALRQYPYPQDPYSQSGYPQYSGGYMSYPPVPTGGSQWYQGGQPQQGEIAASSAESSRQSGQPSQGCSAQSHSGQISRGRGG